MGEDLRAERKISITKDDLLPDLLISLCDATLKNGY